MARGGRGPDEPPSVAELVRWWPEIEGELMGGVTGAPGPARTYFHNQLDALDDAFVQAAMQVAEALPQLTVGFLGGDQQVVQRAIDLSVEVGQVMEAVEDQGFVLLARESPVAGDLRRLVALLRLTTDIDRSAALLKHVCLTLEKFDPRFLPDDLRAQLAELADRASRVYVAGIDAWRHHDALAVSEVDDDDEDVDRLQQLLLEKAAAMDHAGDEMLVLGLIARYFERIADHGVAVAQDAAFVATGQRVKVGKKRVRDEDAG